MRVWYFDIPPGEYKTEEIMKLASPPQTYNAVYLTFRRLKVGSYRLDKENVKYNKRNEKIWCWMGAEYYLKKGPKKKNEQVVSS